MKLRYERGALAESSAGTFKHPRHAVETARERGRGPMTGDALAELRVTPLQQLEPFVVHPHRDDE
jgi:hypothetical protein